MKKLSELFRICDDWHDYQEVGPAVSYKFKEEGGDLYIYFQGSAQWQDWFLNFFIKKTPYKDMEIPYKVHGGFLIAWKAVEDIIIEKITEKGDDGYKWKDITVVGYSHGGSLCAFCTECVWYHRPDLRDGHMRGIAFESPRIFAQWNLPSELAERWNDLLVVRTGDDIVTHCPPLVFGYRNLGTMLKIKGDTSLVKEWYIPHCLKCHYPQVVYDALVKFENGEK